MNMEHVELICGFLSFFKGSRLAAVLSLPAQRKALRFGPQFLPGCSFSRVTIFCLFRSCVFFLLVSQTLHPDGSPITGSESQLLLLSRRSASYVSSPTRNNCTRTPIPYIHSSPDQSCLVIEKGYTRSWAAGCMVLSFALNTCPGLLLLRSLSSVVRTSVFSRLFVVSRMPYGGWKAEDSDS